MPKQRSKKPRKIKRKIKRNDLGIYLLIGFIGLAGLWFITKDPLPETNSTTASESTEKPEKAKKSSKQKTKISKSLPQEQSKILHKQPESPVITEKPATQDFEKAILATLEKLGIPRSYCQRRKKSNQVVFSVPVDRSAMDLIYANMIFKGELERQGGVFVKATDSGGKQSLLFRTRLKPLDYVINLYYDNKLYENKANPRTLAIVVDDFGSISGDLLDGFFELDPSICFAIFPDEANSVATMQRAKAQGRTTIIHVPMEPIGYPSVNPGKNAILVQYNESQIEKMISRFIHQLPDCSGINNHMGSLATTDDDVMRAVMSTLKKHDKFFLDSRTSNVSVGYSIAQKAHLRSFRNDLFLDSPNISQSTLDAKLSQIIELSASKNNIIAITHCHNKEKLDYLKRFIGRARAAGFTLVPITEIGKYNVPELL